MRAAEVVARWRDNPVAFVRECLRAEPDAWQVEVLEAAAKRQRLALKASKGPGKSASLAMLGWWFLCTRPHPKVVCTSITGDNLRDGLWAEFARWQQRSPLLQAAFSWSAERITYNQAPETWFASARQWAKGADASQQANTLAGIHADHVAFLVDEAGGIPDAVVAAAEAGLANAEESRGTTARLILAGNPTHLSGPLYRACTRERPLWWVKEISGDPDDPQRAPRISVEWARDQIAKYGRDNPWVRINVYGEFPQGQSNALVGADVAAAAARRELEAEMYEDAPRVLGIDVARYGDDRTVFFARQGRRAFTPKVLRNLSTMEVAAHAAASIDKWQPDAVFVDATGVGAGVVDRLLQLGYPVQGVDAASRALTASPRFVNRRAEMWWMMADWLKGPVAVPDDAELLAEVTAPTYRFDAGGRLQLEGKQELKSRGLPSPDKADALALTFSAPVVRRRVALPSALRQPQSHDYNPYASEE